MKAILKRDYTESTKIFFEIEVNYNGWAYYVIFGEHCNGGFIAIPNLNICTEAEARGNKFYNTEKLINAGLDEQTAEEIAGVISERIKQI